jgi:hypothetical protein
MVSYQLIASTVLHALDSKSEYGHHRLKKVEYPEVKEQNPKAYRANSTPRTRFDRKLEL